MCYMVHYSSMLLNSFLFSQQWCIIPTVLFTLHVSENYLIVLFRIWSLTQIKIYISIIFEEGK